MNTLKRINGTKLAIVLLTFFIVISCSEDEVKATEASVSAFDCSSADFSVATAVAGEVFSSTLTVAYEGGNGAAYSGSSTSSTGVTGLTITLAEGTLSNGSGQLTYNVSGTPTSSGTASFDISMGDQACTLTLSVTEATTSTPTVSCENATGVAKVICLAEAFKATLSASQISTVQLQYTFSNITTWSNLPAAMAPRKGIKMGSLSSTQLAAAKALIKEISGTTVNEGWEEVEQLWAADDYLQANGGGSTYGAGNYYLAFFGTPSATGTFDIMMTGHHKTVSNTYKNGGLISATPHFAAVEPLTFTASGSTYSPINQERDAFVKLLAALDDTQKSTGKSSSTFSDILLGPGKDWQFPTTSQGLKGDALTTAQKTLLLDVIKTYVNDIDDADAATILATYQSELDNTYILYSGTTAIDTKNDYFRIDGPHVWIEFTVQNGVILNGVHFHSVWRDRVNDYGTTKS
jgi:hypothetical protein